MKKVIPKTETKKLQEHCFVIVDWTENTDSKNQFIYMNVNYQNKQKSISL